MLGPAIEPFHEIAALDRRFTVADRAVRLDRHVKSAFGLFCGAAVEGEDRRRSTVGSGAAHH